MKNIHLIPTEKASRLGYLTKKGKEVFKDLRLFDRFMPNILDSENQNIYITSDEEIKVGDWYYLPRTNSVHECVEDPTELNLERRLGIAKIVLTTDQDLIKDGVQAIDDEFLTWFVKNSECEEVETYSLGIQNVETGESGHYKYEIIIPQEEPKQETLEEAAENNYPLEIWSEEQSLIRKLAFIKGAKWMQEQMYSEEEPDYEKIKQALIEFKKTPMTFVPDERMYSEEEVWNMCNELASYFIDGDTFDLQEWFNQFK